MTRAQNFRSLGDFGSLAPNALGAGLLTPPLCPTAGLPDLGATLRSRATGDLRSFPTAGSGDPRRARLSHGGVRGPAPSAPGRGQETRAERVEHFKRQPVVATDRLISGQYPNAVG